MYCSRACTPNNTRNTTDSMNCLNALYYTALYSIQCIERCLLIIYFQHLSAIHVVCNYSVGLNLSAVVMRFLHKLDFESSVGVINVCLLSYENCSSYCRSYAFFIFI